MAKERKYWVELTQTEFALLSEAIGAAMTATITKRNELADLGYGSLADYLTERHAALNQLRYKLETTTKGGGEL